MISNSLKLLCVWEFEFTKSKFLIVQYFKLILSDCVLHNFEMTGNMILEQKLPKQVNLDFENTSFWTSFLFESRDKIKNEGILIVLEPLKMCFVQNVNQIFRKKYVLMKKALLKGKRRDMLKGNLFLGQLYFK